MKHIIFLLLLPLIFSCSRNDSNGGYEFLTDMVYPVPYEAYSANELMKDGKTMQLPPKNTIARGKMPFPYGVGLDEAKRAGRELKNPFPKTKESLARGGEVYKNYCLLCHGTQGKGDGPLIPKFPNPPSLTGKRLLKYSDGRLFHIITNGSGDMPSHGEQIYYKDRWFLVQYVNFLQETFRKK
ncbi:MAG: cytochrome c [Epsilonproteobacteria bacterium]|nr:MAG: cytochrome c [Campylobacterota bacterium]RLA67699.1 MAG: cytochrome c [Campylobacterota bacterium]